MSSVLPDIESLPRISAGPGIRSACCGSTQPIKVMKIENLIHNLLNEVKKDGEQRLENGVWLVRPAPEIAPKAWTHIVYPPLSESDINDLELQLSFRFPSQIRNFFLHFNGASFFGSQLTLWGKRSSYSRQGISSWQPFDIVSHNAPSERPPGSPYSIVYFGSTECGDKRLFVSKDGVIGKTPTQVFRSEVSWPDFESFFQSQFVMLREKP